MRSGRVVSVPAPDPKANLLNYLQLGRHVLLWKLEGLSEYDIRRPMVGTGTNLLGLVKHCAGVEAGYFGDTFGRPFPRPLPWQGNEDDPNVDMWATADESRDQIVALYQEACAHADATIASLELGATGVVHWWPEERRQVTLHQVLVHVIAETHRHAGHADVVRELIDGSAGMADGRPNLPPEDEAWWWEYRSRLEQAARTAAGGRPRP